MELGLADDQHPDGADSIAFKWVESLWPSLEQVSTGMGAIIDLVQVVMSLIND